METLTADHWVIGIMAFTIVFVLLTLLVKYIFSISKQIKYQEIMIEVLLKIASGEQLDKEQVDKIKERANQA